ncbi:MAG: hypothetical protein NTV05_03830 [Acidobacteria bacterium]|nr:hypothetical protein [Acidobacteriota bacterium]
MYEVFDALVTHYDRQLEELARRLNPLLALPVGVALDPVRATDPTTGEFIPDAVCDIADRIRKDLQLPLVGPTFSAWDASDRGPGVPKLQLRELLEAIQQIRCVLASV